jgi:hypothetical protein
MRGYVRIFGRRRTRSARNPGAKSASDAGSGTASNSRLIEETDEENPGVSGSFEKE